MDKDQTIEIQRVGNGFIVRPSYSVARPNECFLTRDQMVFQTLEAMAAWLAEHFPPKPTIEGCAPPRGVITYPNAKADPRAEFKAVDPRLVDR